MRLPVLNKGAPIDTFAGGAYPQILPSPDRIIYDTTQPSQYGNICVSWAAVLSIANDYNGPVEIFIANGSVIPSNGGTPYAMPPLWYLVCDASGVSIPSGVTFSTSPLAIRSEFGATLTLLEASGATTFTMTNPWMIIQNLVVALGTNGTVISGAANKSVFLRNVQVSRASGTQELMTGAASSIVRALEVTKIQSNLLQATLTIQYDPTSQINNQNGNIGVALSPGGGPPPDAAVVTYTPGTSGNWSPVPTDVGPALDQLAARPGSTLPTLPGSAGTYELSVPGGSGSASWVLGPPTLPGPDGTYDLVIVSGVASWSAASAGGSNVPNKPGTAGLYALDIPGGTGSASWLATNVPVAPSSTGSYELQVVAGGSGGTTYAWTAIPGAGANSTFVFDPNGTAGGNLYTTWSSLATAASGLEYATIFANPGTIASGSYSMPHNWDLYIVGGAQLTIADGATLSTWPSSIRKIGGFSGHGGTGGDAILYNETNLTPPFTFNPATQSGLGFGSLASLVIDGVTITGNGLAPVFYETVADTASAVTLTLINGANLIQQTGGTGGTGTWAGPGVSSIVVAYLLPVGANNSDGVRAYTGSNIGSGTLTNTSGGSTGGTGGFTYPTAIGTTPVYLDASVTIPGSTAGGAGVGGYLDMGQQVYYAPTTSANWSSPPTTVGAALDDLSSGLGWGGPTIAIGQGATASTNGSVGIGYYVTATGMATVAIGLYCYTQYEGDVAIGEYADATGTSAGAVAIGQSASANDTGAVAIGANCTANVANSVAIGFQANSNGFAIGYQVYANDIDAVAIGNNVVASPGQVVIGSNNITVSQGTAVGSGCATHTDGIAIGTNCDADIACLATGTNTTTENTPGMRAHGIPELVQLNDVILYGTTPGASSGESTNLTTSGGSQFLLFPAPNAFYTFDVKVTVGGTISSAIASQSFIRSFNVSSDSSGILTQQGANTLQQFGTANAASWGITVTFGSEITVAVSTGITTSATTISARVTWELSQIAAP